jgi:hypothetical protein
MRSDLVVVYDEQLILSLLYSVGEAGRGVMCSLDLPFLHTLFGW